MLHKLEHKADHDPAKKAFLHKIYEEMITLGFFSFGLILLIDFKILKATDPNLQKFEFAHLWLFMFGIFLVMHNLVGFIVIHKNERNWIKADSEPFESLLDASENLQQRGDTCRLILGGGTVYSKMEYQAMKHIFLHNQSASTVNFRFAKYLQRATSRLLMEHLENISVISWLLLVAVGIGYIAVITTVRDYAADDLWFSFAFGWLLAILSVGLMIIVRKGKTDLIKSVPAFSQLKPGPEDYPKLMKFIYDEQRESAKSAEKDMINRRDTPPAEKNEKNEEESKIFMCGMTTSNVLWINDMITLLQCFFLGLFCTLIIKEALDDFGPGFGFLYILAVLLEQGVVMLWSSPCTVKNVVLIQSTLDVEREIYDEVIDETAELLNLRIMIKERISKNWPKANAAECNKHLQSYFQEIDTDGSGKLGGKELKQLFAKLDFNLHGRQCELIIDEMDNDLSGEVDFEEFEAYLAVEKEADETEDQITITTDGKEQDSENEVNDIKSFLDNKTIFFFFFFFLSSVI